MQRVGTALLRAAARRQSGAWPYGATRRRGYVLRGYAQHKLSATRRRTATQRHGEVAQRSAGSQGSKSQVAALPFFQPLDIRPILYSVGMWIGAPSLWRCYVNDMQPVPWYTSKTMVTALIMGILALLDALNVFKMDNELAERIVELVLVVGAIYIAYRRREPTPPQPITQAQADAIAAQAAKIVKGR